MKRYRLLLLVLSVSLLVVVLSGCFLFQPPAPTNLTATTLSATSIELSWNGSGNNFLIFRSSNISNEFKQISEVKDTSYIDINLSPNTLYYYEVKAKNDFGISNPSNIASTTTFPLSPSTPILKVLSISASTVTLSWNEESNYVEGYIIYRKQSFDSSFTAIKTLTKNITSYFDTALRENSIYYYKIEVFNSKWSMFSNIVKIKTKYTISGYVKDPKGNPVSETEISFGKKYSPVKTNTNGYWIKSNLSGKIVIKPSKKGYKFEPSSTTKEGPATICFEALKFGTIEWKFKTNGFIYSTPAIGKDGTIYLTSMDHYLYAINPNGALKWKFEASSPIYSSPSIGSDGIIYFGSKNGTIYAINPDGSLKWYFETNYEITCDLAIGKDDTVYVISNNSTATLYAFSPSGTLKWKYNELKGSPFDPVIDPFGNIYVNTYFPTGGYFYSISPTGILRWKYKAPNNVSLVANAIIDGNNDNIYVGTNELQLLSINFNQNVKILHKFKCYLLSLTVGPNGNLNVGVNNGTFQLLSINGTLRWKYFFSAPIVTILDGTNSIYIGSADGHIYSLSYTGSLKWLYGNSSISFSGLAMSEDGTLYRGYADGYLYAIATSSSGIAKAPWPVIQHDSRHTGRATTFEFGLPASPENLKIRSHFATSITISWQSISSIENGFEIWRSCQENSNYIKIGSVTANFYTYTDRNISPNKTYYYKVRSYNKIGFSEWSNILKVMKIENGTIKWSYEIYFANSPAVGKGGTIYVGGDALYALDSSNGELKWRFSLKEGDNSNPVIGKNGTIYVGAFYDKYLYAINSNGTLKWKYGIDSPQSAPAIGSDGIIYADGERDNYLYALNPNGTLKWKYEIGNSAISPVIGKSGAIYVCSRSGTVYAINSNGTLKWKYDTKGNALYGNIALDSEENIYVGTGIYLYSFTKKGKLRWKYLLSGNPSFTGVAIGKDNTLYISTYWGKLIALTSKGKFKWKYSTSGEDLCTSTIGDDQVIYFGDDKGTVYAINLDGTLKWKRNFNGSMRPITIFNGEAYVGTGGQILDLYSSSNKLSTSSWPTIQHDITHSGRQ